MSCGRPSKAVLAKADPFVGWTWLERSMLPLVELLAVHLVRMSSWTCSCACAKASSARVLVLDVPRFPAFQRSRRPSCVPGARACAAAFSSPGLLFAHRAGVASLPACQPARLRSSRQLAFPHRRRPSWNGDGAACAVLRPSLQQRPLLSLRPFRFDGGVSVRISSRSPRHEHGEPFQARQACLLRQAGW